MKWCFCYQYGYWFCYFLSLNENINIIWFVKNNNYCPYTCKQNVWLTRYHETWHQRFKWLSLWNVTLQISSTTVHSFSKFYSHMFSSLKKNNFLCLNTDEKTENKDFHGFYFPLHFHTILMAWTTSWNIGRLLWNILYQLSKCNPSPLHFFR